jgi:hypothetical protein
LPLLRRPAPQYAATMAGNRARIGLQLTGQVNSATMPKSFLMTRMPRFLDFSNSLFACDLIPRQAEGISQTGLHRGKHGGTARKPYSALVEG